MTDLEITRLCAEAMGLQFSLRNSPFTASKVMCASHYDDPIVFQPYHPITNDAQVIELVLWLSDRGSITVCPDRVYFEPFGIRPKHEGSKVQWIYVMRKTSEEKRRAICECVAKMQQQAKALGK